MSQYQTLKTQIQQNIKQNGEGEIRGDILQTQLLDMINALGAGYQFMGVATPTNPATAQTPDYKCFYLTTTPGTYANLGGLVVADGEVALLKYDSSWTKEMTGIASVDQISQLPQIVGHPFDNFCIIDENGFAVVMFKDGHVITKNFDSRDLKLKVGNGEQLYDMGVVDENKNALLILSGGHLRTKNFNSKNVIERLNSIAIPGNKKLLDADFSLAIPGDFLSNQNWQIQNGALVSTSPGLGNRLQYSKCTAIDKRTTMCRFTAYSDSVFALGWKTPSETWQYLSTIIGIDAANSKLNIYNAWNTGSLPSVLTSLDYTFVNGRDYILMVRKDGHLNYASIIDCLTGEQSSEIHTTQANIDAEYGEFAGGRQAGYLSLIHLGGTSPKVHWLNVNAQKENPLVIVYGDSITQGARLYNGQSYADLLGNQLGENSVFVSAIDGARISTIIPIMNYEIPILRPKYVMLTIGTNGGGTQDDFNRLKQLIESYGATPIVNVPPCVSDDVPQSWWDYILNLGVQSARFDIATALNNDPEDGRNTALYADSAHPNADGHLEMYKRFIIDTNF